MEKYQRLQMCLKEMESYGISFSFKKINDESLEYGIIQARSNNRFWLIPLINRNTAISSMALFQPLTTSAFIAKLAVNFSSYLGLTKYVIGKLYLNSRFDLIPYYSNITQPTFAIFTGTDSPHRKVALQVMNIDGEISGYIKISQNPEVSKLLYHEARILHHVQSLRLSSANIPNLIHIGDHNSAIILATDTLRTRESKSPVRISIGHTRFLAELSNLTRLQTVHAEVLSLELKQKFNSVGARFEIEWSNRIDNLLAILNHQKHVSIPLCLSHGDFTPWNTFIAQGKLYVFDWEYAEMSAPASNDLIHFVLNQAHVRNRSARYKLKAVKDALTKHMPAVAQELHLTLTGLYLLSQVLRQVERIPKDGQVIENWDGMVQQRELMDLLIATTKE